VTKGRLIKSGMPPIGFMLGMNERPGQRENRPTRQDIPGKESASAGRIPERTGMLSRRADTEQVRRGNLTEEKEETLLAKKYLELREERRNCKENT